MTRWRRWVFECQAPADEFQQHLERALVLRGVAVEAGEHFAIIARAMGARAYVSLAWAKEGIELSAKLKGGLFASPKGLERLLLESGREAQARLLPYGPPARLSDDAPASFR